MNILIYKCFSRIFYIKDFNLRCFYQGLESDLETSNKHLIHKRIFFILKNPKNVYKMILRLVLAKKKFFKIVQDILTYPRYRDSNNYYVDC